ncbi:VaFE repeat-containing surface-anchored protein [Corynebacterium pseudotuberculosis]|uniref:VaFE repeat-containing surface-anchored protein n=1 Tax=Corynebacterium pseudotuberculosis TaxID=1719 RepID=UPI0001E5F257|nr:VaFE repeat-containing surface-anchored protein [Corynebacterium pseudotuberculosis]ADO25459.1 VaFE repeat-containing surface-anchored protein [Corynebacterium pseudotuberculosis I19]AKI58578.1 VaFE repeat-containing surface-anchored protein [Corynebacterium pseudotuberculosis]
MRSKPFKKVVALLTGIDIAFSANTSVQAEEVGPDYLGYLDEAAAVKEPFGDGRYQNHSTVPPLVVKATDGGEEELAYCFNITKPYPVFKDSFPSDTSDVFNRGIGLRYKGNYGVSLQSFASRWRGEGADAGVLKAVYNGHSHNAAGLKESLGLTEEEFRYATQLAVWYWTDSDSGSKYLIGAGPNSNKIGQAVKILTGQDKSSVQLKEVDPNLVTLVIYKPYSLGGEFASYQNLLSVKFVSPKTGDSVNPEDPTKPEPKEPEKPKEPEAPQKEIEPKTPEEPTLKTSATDQSDNDKLISATGGKVVDKVTYTGLKEGEKYLVEGELMDKETSESTGIKAEATFTASGANGTVDVIFDIDAAQSGKTLVAFEKLYKAEDKGTVVASHEDINDKAQTVVVEKDVPVENEDLFTPEVPDDSSFNWKYLIPFAFIPVVGALIWGSSQGSSSAAAQTNPAYAAPVAPAPATVTTTPAPKPAPAAATPVKKQLAATGANVLWTLLVALVLVAAGVFLVRMRRNN